jgi:hypothetical protein
MTKPVNDLRDDEDHRVVYLANVLRQYRQGHEYDPWDCRACSQGDVDWARRIIDGLNRQTAARA